MIGAISPRTIAATPPPSSSENVPIANDATAT
jgi:hypothetical protein